MGLKRNGDYVKTNVGLIAIVIGLLAATSSYSQKDDPKRSGSSSTVVLELFTSEGCSSCPPADALLAKIESIQPFPDTHIIAIEEHVDYWNQQGWIDPFSSSEWTQRQRTYVLAFRQDGEYTPQVVVNGSAQLIGSRMNELTKAVSEAARSAQAIVEVAQVGAGSERDPRFSVTVDKVPASDGDAPEVWAAVTESGLSSQVTAGENAGRKLPHASVLRSLRRINGGTTTTAGSFRGEFSPKLKNDWKRENLAIVVFVQQKKSRRILGAASLRIASSQP